MKYLPIALISSFVIRLLITGASIGDSISLLSLTGLYAVYLYLESKKEVPVNKEILNRIVELEEALKETRASVSSMKLINSNFKR